MRVVANRAAETITAAVRKRFSSLIIELPVQQDGEGDPSPDNVRYITQWSKVDAFVADSISEDTPVATVELSSPIYGGRIDVVRGEVASTYNVKMNATGWEMVEEGQFRCSVSAYNNGNETSTNVADLYSSHYKTVSNKDAYDGTDDLTCGLATIDGITYLYVNDADYTTLEAFTAYVGVVMFVYKAHIPMSDTVDPQIIFLPEGTSYVWATGVEVVADVVIELVGNAAPIVRYFPHNSVATECNVSFTPVQDLHGYDYPWPAGGGVNKFGPNTTPTSEAYIKSNGDTATGSTATDWIISDYISVLPETQYTFKPNTTSGAAAYFAYYASDKTLISTIASSNTTFTTPASCAFMKFSYRSTSYDIQLELGDSVSATYTPYSNLCPIHGWTGCEVTASTGEYKALEYITIPPNAYINTGFVSNSENLEIRTKLQPNDYAQYRGIYGNYISETANAMRLLWATNNSRFYSTANSKTGESLEIMLGSTSEASGILEITQKMQEATINSTTVTRPSASAGTANNTPLVLGQGSVTSTSAYGIKQLYYFDIFDNSVAVMQLRPAKRLSDNAVGLYDLVSGTFMASETETACVAGSDAFGYYPQTTASVTFPTQYGGIADVVHGTGNSTWVELDIGDISWSSGWTGFYNSNPLAVSVATTGDATNLVKCEVYKPIGKQVPSQDMVITAVWGGEGYASNGRLWIRDSRFSTPEEFKTAMTGTKIYAVTSTPIPFTFTPASDELTIQKNKNYLWATMT